MSKIIGLGDENESISGVTSVSNPEQVLAKEWKPTQKQREVLQLPDTIFECLGGGAAGGGKTDLTILEDPTRQLTEHPKFKALILRRTYADLEKEIIPRSTEWYAPAGAVYNETKKRWTWPSGAITQFGHAEREQDVRKYDTAEYNTIKWEEATGFTGFQYLYLTITRCRSSSPDLPAFVRGYTNPGNVGHGFFKKRFIDPCPAGRRIIIDKITRQKRIYIPFLGKDNPHLLKNDPTYLVRLEGLPEVEKKAKLYGDWSSYEGQVFSEFRILHLADEPENAFHVMPPAVIPEWWPKILCIDWGWEAMTFAIWAAISPIGRCYIYRTWFWTKTTIKEWSRECVNLSGDEQFEDALICHSAGQHRGEEKTILEQVNESFDGRATFRLGDRDRVGGKSMVHEYLRWEQRPHITMPEVVYDQELAAAILRKGGEQKYYEYLAQFSPPEPERNIPKLQIFSHCYPQTQRENKELIDVIPSCVPAENNPEDVEEFQGDDPYDCLRMIVKCANRYVDMSSAEHERRKKLQKVLDDLAATYNQTNFYRQMEKLEKELTQHSSVRARSRLGHRRIH